MKIYPNAAGHVIVERTDRTESCGLREAANQASIHFMEKAIIARRMELLCLDGHGTAAEQALWRVKGGLAKDTADWFTRLEQAGGARSCRSSGIETRSASASMTRQTEVLTKAPGTIAGYAAVFYRHGDVGTEFAIGPQFLERIAPGAFDSVFKRKDDVRDLANHDPRDLLGRTTSGSMSLKVDGRGLRYEIDLPDNHLGRQIEESVRRGDLSGSSFAFKVIRQRFVRAASPKENDLRYIEDVELHDVGPVTYPAYRGASVSI